MSYSKSLSGSAASVLAALAAFPAAQKATDETYASAGVINGHQQQIEETRAAVEPVLKALPDDASVSGNIWGHANDDGAGTWGYSLSVSGAGSTPAIVAPAEPQAATT